MIPIKKLQAKFDGMSLAELKNVEQDFLDPQDLVTLTYIRKRIALAEAEPAMIRRNTFLAVAIVGGISILYLASYYIFPAISTWFSQ